MEKYFAAEAYLLKELEKMGIEIKLDHKKSTNSNFRYFEYEGQRIDIDDYNRFLCPMFCAAEIHNVKNMLKIMKEVQLGRRNIYTDFSQSYDDAKPELEFVWGEKESILVMEFSDDLVARS